MAWIERQLKEIRCDSEKVIDDPIMLVSIEKMTNLFSCEQLVGAHVVYRDRECLALEWPCKIDGNGLYCCVYTESIEVDRVLTPMKVNDGWCHDICIFGHHEIEAAVDHIKALL